MENVTIPLSGNPEVAIVIFFAKGMGKISYGNTIMISRGKVIQIH